MKKPDPKLNPLGYKDVHHESNADEYGYVLPTAPVRPPGVKGPQLNPLAYKEVLEP